MELWCQQSAQRTFNPPGAGANPASSTNNCHLSVIEGGRTEKSSGAERPGTAACHDVPEQRRGRSAKPVLPRVQIPPSCPFPFGAVMIIAACRTCNADETERNRPAPPICPGGVDRCMTAFQAEGAGALPAPGTTGPRCPSGRVGFQVRPGGCESLRTCHFYGG